MCKLFDYKEPEPLKPVKSPCKGCANRVVGCHSTCEPYIAYWNYNREVGRRKRLDTAIYDYVRDSQKKRRY